MRAFLPKLLIIVIIILSAILTNNLHDNFNASKKQLPVLLIKPYTKIEDTTKSTLSEYKKSTENVFESVRTTLTNQEETDYIKGADSSLLCEGTTYYKLGTFDSRFNITKDKFLNEVQIAAEVWNTASGKKLFVYDKTGEQATLTINLIYDERQANTDRNKLLFSEIENTREVMATLKSKYELEEILFEKLKEQYTNEVSVFESRQKNYNESVATWNEKGGAPEDVYNSLMTEKEALKVLADNLEIQRKELEIKLESINSQITRYNELVSFSNQNIDINNSSANKKFTEGSYINNPKIISIFQFSDIIKLKRVLMHEFGHATGVDHVEGRDSIMYSVNSSTSTKLSSNDIAELATICKE